MAKLAVLTGYPACGKSTVSRFLERDMGYARLSGDDISEELFGHTYPYSEGEDPERIWQMIHQRRDRLLAEGRDVVIDTTAYDGQRRAGLFSTPAPAEKYLVWLQVSPKTMAKREKGKKWAEGSIERWKAKVGWEDPEEGEYHLLVYANDTQADKERIKSELIKELA